MKPQTPAQGISVDNVFDTAQVFNVECDCGSVDHAVKMWIEVKPDVDVQLVEVSFFVNAHTPNTWTNWSDRLRAVWAILTNGVYRQEHHMILNQQTALNFAAAITKTVKNYQKPAK